MATKGAEDSREKELEELAQSLARTVRHLARWRRRQGIEAWRLYDRDLLQYPAVVDVYADRAHVREIASAEETEGRMEELASAVAAVADVDMDKIFIEKRRPQHHGEGRGARANPVPEPSEDSPGFEVQEGGHRFWICFSDRLDPGLFLDHRRTRQWVAERSKGRRVLNLFCYTASFSVYAAKAGASETVSIDLSPRTLRWARRNFEINGIDEDQHRLVRADCIPWLREQARDPRQRASFDLIVLDPPTFSNSKAMYASFDVQRDHIGLIRHSMDLLAVGGSLVFSTNRRRFGLDEEISRRYSVRDLGGATRSKDFERRPDGRHCFHLRHREESQDGGE